MQQTLKVVCTFVLLHLTTSLSYAPDYLISHGRLHPQQYLEGLSSTLSFGENAARFARSKEGPAQSALDLCKVCACDRPNAFTTVTCDFQLNPNVSSWCLKILQ